MFDFEILGFGSWRNKKAFLVCAIGCAEEVGMPGEQFIAVTSEHDFTIVGRASDPQAAIA